MNTSRNIIALVGTYRKGGVVDIVVDIMLEAARDEGAQTTKVYLIDENIAFCTNCRACTQEPGQSRGACILQDNMSNLLDAIEQADAIILASPMNFGTVTAVTKRFIERLVCYAYWPWGKGAPRIRTRKKDKRGAVVITSAAPAIMARPFSSMVRLMNDTVKLLGAKKSDLLFIGLAAMQKEARLSPRVQRKAKLLGEKLASKK
jgi:multimeric flavodoxin WrbA